MKRSIFIIKLMTDLCLYLVWGAWDESFLMHWMVKYFDMYDSHDLHYYAFILRRWLGVGSEMARRWDVMERLRFCPCWAFWMCVIYTQGDALGWELLALQAGVGAMGWDNVGPSGPIVNIQNLNQLFYFMRFVLFYHNKTTISLGWFGDSL